MNGLPQPARLPGLSHTLSAPRPSGSCLIGLRPAVLAFVTGLSLIIYLIGLLAPYSVFRLGLPPGLTLASLTQGDPAAQAFFVLTVAGLAGTYLLAWRICRPIRGQSGLAPWPMWVVLLGSALVTSLLLLWLYPIGAADVFDYIGQGRVLAAWHANPFYTPLAAFPADPFYRYAGWAATTTAYGPLWIALAAATTWLAGPSLLLNLLAFKLLGVAFYLGSLALLVGLLRRWAPRRALAGTCLFALNPLVLYETAGNGHNDIVLVFFLLLTAWALSHKRHALAVAALAAGALVKYVPALLLPILLAYSLRALPDWRSRLRYLFTAGLVAAFALLFGLLFWRGGDMAAVERRAEMFTTSLPALLQAVLEPGLGAGLSSYLVSRAAILVTLVAAHLLAWHTWWRTDSALSIPGRRARAWLEPVRSGALLLLFYLLAAGLWFQSWYALWPLALVALLAEGPLAYAAMLLAYSALWKAIVFDFFVHAAGPLPPRLWREAWLAPAVFAVPWFYVLCHLTRVALARRRVVLLWLATRRPAPRRHPAANPTIG